jgi:hypothetical protein
MPSPASVAWQSSKKRCAASGQAGLVVGVDQQHVEAPGGLAQEGGTVGFEYFEARIVRRNAEGLAQRDHVGIDLDDRDPRARQVPVAELRERAAAESDHAEMHGRRHEQQKAHHHPRVWQRERVRLAHVHATLHLVPVEVQRARGAGVGDERPWVAGRGRLGHGAW